MKTEGADTGGVTGGGSSTFGACRRLAGSLVVHHEAHMHRSLRALGPRMGQKDSPQIPGPSAGEKDNKWVTVAFRG